MHKYQVVVEEVIRSIEEGIIKSGNRLPSIREYSKQIGAGKATVIRAYKELESRHYIYSIAKSGFYVAHVKERKESLEGMYDFCSVGPDQRVIPFQGFLHAMNQAISRYSSRLFDYDKPEGLETLRMTLVDFFADQGVHTHAENLIVTTGAQQGLYLIISAIMNGKKRGDVVMGIEQPTYRVIHRIADIKGLELVGIERSEKGIDFDELEKVFRRVDYFYTVTRFQNPQGFSYTEREKKRLLALAEKHHVMMIEDDYLADLETSRGSMPIHYYDTSGIVIYVKSFSKGFMPGIRLGCVVCPSQWDLREEIIKLKYIQDFCAPVYTQGALEVYLTSGMYMRHLEKVKMLYSQKMKKISSYILANKPNNVAYTPSRTGIYVWLRVSDIQHVFFARLKRKNVAVIPGGEYFIDGQDRRDGEITFCLCVGHMMEEEVFKGLEIIFQTIRECVVTK